MTRILPGRWICIDGVEATGKTTIAEELTATLGAVSASEFSDTYVGKALKEAVKTSPHYISKSPLGQSLVFLGDFIELFHGRVKPALSEGKTVVTDRGFLSKYAYQEVVLKSDMTTKASRILLDAIFRHLPVPHFTLVLTAPQAILRQRLLERGENCDEQRLLFMERANVAAREVLKRRPEIIAKIVDTNRPIGETIAEIQQRLSDFLYRK